MTEYTNEYGPVDILGPGPLTERFTRVRMSKKMAYLESIADEYLVFTDTLQYRMDGQPHDLDVRELKVLSSEVIEGSDETVSVTLEVKL